MTEAGELLGAGRVRELLKAHGVRPSRALGQNFVVDPNTIRKTLAIAGVSSSDRVMEIGAGAGSLTVGLAACAPSVVAIERDERLIPLLQEVLANVPNVELIHGDALKLDLSRMRTSSLVANLPYNIAALLVLKVLEEAPEVQSLTVMTQKEVGERLAAVPGTKSYGATSVLVAFLATARVEAQVSRRAFWPVPRVDSVIVRIARRPEPSDSPREIFFKVVKAAFSQRRKTLRNSLADLAGSGETAEKILRSAGIEPSLRAEMLSADDFLRLCSEFD